MQSQKRPRRCRLRPAVMALEEQQQYLTFMLSGETYAISILRIKEIIQYGQLTEVPRMPDFIRGVINLQGRGGAGDRPERAFRQTVHCDRPTQLHHHHRSGGRRGNPERRRDGRCGERGAGDSRQRDRSRRPASAPTSAPTLLPAWARSMASL